MIDIIKYHQHKKTGRLGKFCGNFFVSKSSSYESRGVNDKKGVKIHIFDALYDDEVCSLVYIQDQAPSSNLKKKALKKGNEIISQ